MKQNLAIHVLNIWSSYCDLILNLKTNAILIEKKFKVISIIHNWKNKLYLKKKVSNENRIINTFIDRSQNGCIASIFNFWKKYSDKKMNLDLLERNFLKNKLLSIGINPSNSINMKECYVKYNIFMNWRIFMNDNLYSSRKYDFDAVFKAYGNWRFNFLKLKRLNTIYECYEMFKNDNLLKNVFVKLININRTRTKKKEYIVLKKVFLLI